MISRLLVFTTVFGHALSDPGQAPDFEAVHSPELDAELRRLVPWRLGRRPSQPDRDEGCVLDDGTTPVDDGWTGLGAGHNWCNQCSCEDGVLACTRMFCGEEPRLGRRPRQPDSSDSSTHEGCVLDDGTTPVDDGWTGFGAGYNWCNQCSCSDGALACTRMFCGEEPRLGRRPRHPDSDSSTDGGCVLDDGTTPVDDGWSGFGAGHNWCNQCSCSDGVLACTRMFCGEEPRLGRRPGGGRGQTDDVCDRIRCGFGLICIDGRCEAPAQVCTMDVKECPDGSYVSRDHSNNCEWHACPEPQLGRRPGNRQTVFCTADVMECPDGSYVSRDHSNNCEWHACPESRLGRRPGHRQTVVCPADVMECPDGSYVSRDHSNNCEWHACPESRLGRRPGNRQTVVCPADVMECPDGSYVSRDHSNNCEWHACPESRLGRRPGNRQTVFCPLDVKECPDGSYVSRDHSNNCEWHACPDY